MAKHKYKKFALNLLVWCCECYGLDKWAQKLHEKELRLTDNYREVAAEFPSGADQLFFSPMRWLTVFFGKRGWGINIFFTPLIAGSVFAGVMYVVAKTHRIGVEDNRTSLANIWRKLGNPNPTTEDREALKNAILQNVETLFGTEIAALAFDDDTNPNQFTLTLKMPPEIPQGAANTSSAAQATVAQREPHLWRPEQLAQDTKTWKHVHWWIDAFKNYAIYYWVTWFVVCFSMSTLLAFPYWWILATALGAQILMPIVVRAFILLAYQPIAKLRHWLKTPKVASPAAIPPTNEESYPLVENFSAEDQEVARNLVRTYLEEDPKLAAKIAAFREFEKRKLAQRRISIAIKQPKTAAATSSKKHDKSALGRLFKNIERNRVKALGIYYHKQTLINIARVSGFVKGFTTTMFLLFPLTDAILYVIALAEGLTLETAMASQSFILAATSMSVISAALAVVVAIHVMNKHAGDMKMRLAKQQKIAADLERIKEDCIKLQNEISSLTGISCITDDHGNKLNFNDQDSISAFIRELEIKPSTGSTTFFLRTLDGIRTFIDSFGTGITFARFLFQPGSIASIIAYGFSAEALSTLMLPIINIGATVIPAHIVFLGIAAIFGVIWGAYKVHEFRIHRNMKHQEEILKGLINYKYTLQDARASLRCSEEPTVTSDCTNEEGRLPYCRFFPPSPSSPRKSSATTSPAPSTAITPVPGQA